MKNKQFGELAVCGFAAVKALERENEYKIRRFYYTASRARQFGSLCKKLAARRAIYNEVSPEELEKLCGSVHHQGVAAMIRLSEPQAVTAAIASDWARLNERVLVLDHIGNANNFGAIIRSAAFFGVKKIVIANDETQSAITTSAYRVAQGGMEYTTIYGTDSIADLVALLAARMPVVCADVSGARPPSVLTEYASRGEGIAVVLGNEEKGVSPKVRALCTASATIRGSGVIESLNVAQAAAVLFYCMSARA